MDVLNNLQYIFTMNKYLLTINLFFLLVLCTNGLKFKLNDDNSTLYLFHEDYCTWDGTYPSHCISNSVDGEQVIINDSKTNQLVPNLITEWTWIGARKKSTEVTFKWWNGEPVTYTNWAEGEPDNGPRHRPSGDPKFCIAIDTDGMWHDAPCYYAFHTLRAINVTDRHVMAQLYEDLTESGFGITSEEQQLFQTLNNTVNETDSIGTRNNSEVRGILESLFPLGIVYGSKVTNINEKIVHNQHDTGMNEEDIEMKINQFENGIESNRHQLIQLRKDIDSSEKRQIIFHTFSSLSFSAIIIVIGFYIYKRFYPLKNLKMNSHVRFDNVHINDSVI